VSEQFPGEADLVLRARTDADAFGTLYEHYAPLIYRFVHNRLRDRTAAEDVTADVFFKALRALDRYEPSGRPFRVWLYRIAANTITDHLRTRRPTLDLDAALEQRDPAPPVDEQVAGRFDLRRVWSAMSGLNEAQRLAINLKLGQDMHTSEIAAVMGRSEGAVKLLIHRGLTTIRERLGEGRRAEGTAS
jgi:RNA polymerase sigma-70 factor (ECF subfamily)